MRVYQQQQTHPSDSGCCPSKTVVMLLLIRCLLVPPCVGPGNCSMFCCALLCVLSGFAINLMGKREQVAFLCLSSWCLMIIVWLFHTIQWVCLQFVIVVFPDHTHLLFLAPAASTVSPPPPPPPPTKKNLEL